MMNPTVDFYFDKEEKWQKELRKLRKIVLSCGLTEELKWGCPCYTLPNGKSGANIVLIHTFKDYCALLFFKGALLTDPDGILVQQTERVQAARQLRFTNIRGVTVIEDRIKSFVFEAMELERTGARVKLKKTEEFSIPDELQNKLDEMPAFKTAFDSLTPGRQRGYILHFSAPKQSKTRVSRIENAIPNILEGRGLNDR